MIGALFSIGLKRASIRFRLGCVDNGAWVQSLLEDDIQLRAEKGDHRLQVKPP